MNKNKYIFVFILLLCLIPSIAKGSTLVMDDWGVTIRKGPGTNYDNIGTTGDTGQEFTLKNTDLHKTVQGCGSGYWYNVVYNNQSAYICSSYAHIKAEPIVITTEARNQCEQDLKTKGFPETYWNALCDLKAKYPNWDFQAVYTGYDFSAVVSKESCKNSIGNTTSNRNKGYIDDSCNAARDSGYISASTTAIAYYMNPLNFLNEKNIFMFESNFNNGNIGTYDAISRSIIPSSTYFVQFMPYVYGHITSAASVGISPAFVSTRIKQEMGSGDLGYSRAPDNTRLYSCLYGNYTTRDNTKTHPDGSSLNNYYNYYNIAAYDGSNVTHKALIYAKNHNWGGTGNQEQDRKTAVVEGARWIYDNYTNRGQQTIYFNKFNVNPNSKSAITNHQYMTNIDAAVSESSIMYDGYRAANSLGQNRTFYIPIFGNQAAPINNTPGGATADTNNSNTGLEPSTMVISAGLSVSGTTISGIKGNTSISDIKGRIQSQGGTVNVYSGTSLVNDGLIGTGMRVNVSSSNGSADYTIIVKGDPSGDGRVDTLDLLQIQKYILGQKKLDSAYLTAADTSGDGKVDTLDLLQIQKAILGQKEL